MDLDERKPALHWLLLLAVAESSCTVLQGSMQSEGDVLFVRACSRLA
jgi:hypothetical protein